MDPDVLNMSLSNTQIANNYGNLLCVQFYAVHPPSEAYAQFKLLLLKYLQVMQNPISIEGYIVKK